MALQENKYHQLEDSLLTIQDLINNEHLNLEEHAQLVEHVRRISLYLIEEVHSFTVHKEETQKIAKNLLGFILAMPRMEENDTENMLEKALYQIECLQVVSKDIQNYLQKNYQCLCIYIRENREKPL